MHKTLRVYLGFVLCLGGGAGFVAPAAAASTNGLNLAVLAEAADYESSEYRFGSVLDRELGNLIGESLHAEYARGGWRIGLLQRSLAGLIDYQGQTQLGLPIQSHTDLHYSQFGLTTTYQFESLPVYVGLAWRTRKVDRFIEATPITQALHETLRQTEWGPVVGMTWKASDKVRFDAHYQALVTTRSTLSVDFLGSYDPGELSMPRNWCHEFQFSLRYQITDAYGVIGQFNYQQFSPSASDYALLTKNGAVVGAYYYPGSSQSIAIFGAGLFVHW